MRKDIDIIPDDGPKKFKGPAKKGEIRNPAGRPVESEETKVIKRTAHFQFGTTKTANEMRKSLYDLFQRSDALSILSCFFNMKIPPSLRPAGYIPGVTQITPMEDSMIRSNVLKNFKWAVEQMVKLMPKEMVGTIQGEVTLIGMIKRASVENKSSKVIDLVQKRREKEVYETEDYESQN